MRRKDHGDQGIMRNKAAQTHCPLLVRGERFQTGNVFAIGFVQSKALKK